MDQQPALFPQSEMVKLQQEPSQWHLREQGIALAEIQRARLDALSKVVLQIKIQLQHIHPPVWRRLHIAADTPMYVLHEIIQRMFGWENEHLHSFEVPLPGRRRLLIDEQGMDNPFALLGMGRTEHLSETTTAAGEVLRQKKTKCLYWYDFRVDWKHDILVEEILPREAGTTYPLCIKARRAAPAEDMGGPWGYTVFLKALDNAKHPDRKNRSWLYEEYDDFDPDECDVGDLNEQLRESYRTRKEYEKEVASRFRR